MSASGVEKRAPIVDHLDDILVSIVPAGVLVVQIAAVRESAFAAKVWVSRTDCCRHHLRRFASFEEAFSSHTIETMLFP